MRDRAARTCLCRRPGCRVFSPSGRPPLGRVRAWLARNRSGCTSLRGTTSSAAACPACSTRSATSRSSAVRPGFGCAHRDPRPPARRRRPRRPAARRQRARPVPGGADRRPQHPGPDPRGRRDDDAIATAMLAGAAGYLLEQINASSLVNGIRLVASGHRWSTGRCRPAWSSTYAPQEVDPGDRGPHAAAAQDPLPHRRGADQPRDRASGCSSPRRPSRTMSPHCSLGSGSRTGPRRR